MRRRQREVDCPRDPIGISVEEAHYKAQHPRPPEPPPPPPPPEPIPPQPEQQPNPSPPAAVAWATPIAAQKPGAIKRKVKP